MKCNWDVNTKITFTVTDMHIASVISLKQILLDYAKATPAKERTTEVIKLLEFLQHIIKEVL